MAYEVMLSRDQEPFFPSVCIVCNRADPNRFVRVSSELIEGLNSTLNPWAKVGDPGDGAFAVHAPACRMCIWRFRFSEYGGIAVITAIAGTGYILFHERLAAVLPKKMQVLIAGIALMPLAIGWRALFPPPLELVALEDHVTYRFTDEVYKNTFALQNPRQETYEEIEE